MQQKISVGVLGATGRVGQAYVQRLLNHPWFELTFLAASDKSAGKTYEEALQGRWQFSDPLPKAIALMPVQPISSIAHASDNCKIVFSAVDTATAKEYEPQYAAAGLAVVSNAGAYRRESDIPLLIPEINADHLKLIPIQRKRRGWGKGCLVTKPNCAINSFMLPLAPLKQAFGLKSIQVTTLQAVSGAGYPGVSSLDIHDNVLPLIAGEEEKVEQEPLKIWGKIQEEEITNCSLAISAQCTRVPVLDGHMACVSATFGCAPEREEIIFSWHSFKSKPQLLNLPSAPPQPVIYREESDRPQPRLDRLAGEGMSVSVGRLRSCPLAHVRFVGLSHNLIRGAAGGGILNAELLIAEGYVE